MNQTEKPSKEEMTIQEFEKYPDLTRYIQKMAAFSTGLTPKEWTSFLQCLNQSLTPKDDAVENEKLLSEAKELIEYFVKRVNEGTIRSKTTYAMYVNFLAKFKSSPPKE